MAKSAGTGLIRAAAGLAGVALLAAAPVTAQDATSGSLLVRVDWLPPWKSLEQKQRERREAIEEQRRQERRRERAASATYRTICVRTCDGYYFPISFKATRAQFSRDATDCHRRCDSKARLFVYRNPGQDVSGAVDLKGHRYVDLTNAFLYRKELVKGCECNPVPWSEAAEEARKTLINEQAQTGGQ